MTPDQDHDVPLGGPPERDAKPKGELRKGWTTGACAAAATRAAYKALLTGGFPIR